MPRLVNSNFGIAGAGFGRRAAPRRLRQDADHSRAAVKRKPHDASRADRLARLFDSLAVDPDMARLDQRVSEGTAFHQPDTVKEAVDTQRVADSFKCSGGTYAKAWHAAQEEMMGAPEGWTVSEDGKALTCRMEFRDFSQAFAFLTRVALHAEKVDHHPEFTSVWNTVDFRLTSHDVGGITDRDRKLAEAINGLAAAR